MAKSQRGFYVIDRGVTWGGPYASKAIAEAEAKRLKKWFKLSLLEKIRASLPGK
jgi:hypothetical protein